MNNLLVGLIVLGATMTAWSQTKPLPNVKPPQELVRGEFSEGTVTRLNAQDVQQFVPWAQNAKNVLTKTLKDSKMVPVRERLQMIETAVKSVVRNSGTKTYQMFMRFALNRGLLLEEELKRQANIDDIGIRENSLDILVKSIEVALSFYESDLSFQDRAQAGNTNVSLGYAQFGLQFGQAMMPVVSNIFDASAEYRLVYKLYEMINWDMSRDPNALDFSDQIVEIYDRLQSMNEFPAPTDEVNLSQIRRLMLLKDSVNQLSDKLDVKRPLFLVPASVGSSARVNQSNFPDSASLIKDAAAGKIDGCVVKLGVEGWANQLYVHGVFSGNHTLGESDKLSDTIKYHLRTGRCHYDNYSANLPKEILDAADGIYPYLQVKLWVEGWANQLYVNGVFNGNFNQDQSGNLAAAIRNFDVGRFPENVVLASKDKMKGCVVKLLVEGWASQLYVNGNFQGNFTVDQLSDLSSTIKSLESIGTCSRN